MWTVLAAGNLVAASSTAGGLGISLGGSYLVSGTMLPVMATEGGPRRLYDTVRKAARPGPLEDDFSALALRFV